MYRRLGYPSLCSYIYGIIIKTNKIKVMTNTESIINFMYFGHNYPHNFIAKVWAGKETLTEEDKYSLTYHLTKKFHTMYDQFGTLTFFRWYMELDNGNKSILNSYIADNYKS